MSLQPLTCWRESAMGSAARTFDLISLAGDLAWYLSAAVLRGVKDLCRPDPHHPHLDELTGAGLERALRRRDYAPSTARRYRQIVDRFVTWLESPAAAGRSVTSATSYLATWATQPNVGTDPRHLALRRTTLCALRSAVDRPLGLDLTTGLHLPPRPRPVPATAPDLVAVLRSAASTPRERLLLVLACDLGLRPGVMVSLRRDAVHFRRGRVHLAGAEGSAGFALPSASRAVLKAVTRSRAPGPFVLQSPHHGGEVALTVRTLQNTLRSLCTRAGITGSVTFTSLRKASTRMIGMAQDAPARSAECATRTSHKTAKGPAESSTRPRLRLPPSAEGAVLQPPGTPAGALSTRAPDSTGPVPLPGPRPAPPGLVPRPPRRQGHRPGVWAAVARRSG